MTEKPKKVAFPKSPYDRILTQDEVAILLKQGWRAEHAPYPCEKCRGAGCDRCNHVGIILNLYKEKRFYFGNPIVNPYFVGARCWARVQKGILEIVARGGGGEANLRFYMPQMFSLMRLLINGLDMQSAADVEYGIEAQFRGPPAVALAALSTKRVTVSTSLSKKQKKAIEVLLKAGLRDEAELFKSACEHEIFRGDREEHEKARKSVGKIKPGTIFQRKGKTTVLADGTVVNVDQGRSVLSALT